MFTTLFTTIKGLLDAVTKLSKVYPFPASKLEGFPCAVFYPDNVTNEFNSNAENYKVYGFKIFIICETKIAGKETAFKTILAGAVDAVIQKFDTAWNGGTISGHRAWYRLDNGVWSDGVYQDSEIVYAELNLSIKILTNN